MTDDQINAAIAYACGWKEIDGLSAKGLMGKPPEALCSFNYIPNYCKDLNAMQKAEDELTFEDWELYCDELGGSLRGYARATSRQRAEAFLRTLGKWEEAVVKGSFTTEEAK
jgi:hypothetical protein